MNKEQKQFINHLALREAYLTLREREDWRDSNLELEVMSAWIEMMAKVKTQREGTAREFWESNLMIVSKALDEVKNLKDQIARLTHSYEILYTEYQRVSQVVEEERKNF